MEVIVVQSAEELAAIVADAIVALTTKVERPTLGLATGSSPQPIYDELVRRHRAGRVSFANTTACLLDEYVGLDAQHPQRYRAVIGRSFLDHVDLAPENLLGPDVHAGSLAECSTRYEESLKRVGGVDIQLLGIGSDGHIGFNEPISSLTSRTRVKTLALRTREDNARFFDGDVNQVPKHAVTQGIGTILEARHLILVAMGSNKRESIARAVEGPLTAMVPASALQWHAHATVIVDEGAAAGLELIDYYRQTLRDKPEWQGI